VTRNHVAVVNENGPDLDGNEENHVEVSVHGADEDEGASHVLVDEGGVINRDGAYW
jgi:hypothetical protein